MPPIALIGQVTKAGVMNKTVTVTVSRKVTHPRVGKELIRSKKYLVHDPNNECKLGNSVVIQNCRPLSARKSFVFVKTLAESEKQRMMERFAAEQESVAQAAHGTGAAH